LQWKPSVFPDAHDVVGNVGSSSGVGNHHFGSV
jgi:hypothetical protein